MERVVALVDMNSFYASCHQAFNPELDGKEVIVAGEPERRTGIVLAASYQAKAKGVGTGMALWEAKKLCPDGYFFKPNYPLYIDFSSRILHIMRDFTDLVEPFSIDEAFIDFSGIINLWGPPVEIAAKIRQRILSEIGVQCSIGIGPNKLIAKMAAGLQKPNGLTIIKTVNDYRNVFYSKPVRKLFGIGSRYEKHLRKFNVFTIGELANYPVEILKKRWGKNGEMLWYCAQGLDHSPVTSGSPDTDKSIGQQRTLPRDIRGFKDIQIIILELCEMVARRARQGGYVGRTVFLTLRDTQLEFISRSMTIPDPTNLAGEIYQAACKLLHKNWDQSWAVRLVGVTLSNLKTDDYIQYDLFGEKEKQVKLAKVYDKICNRFGERAIFRGISLTEVSLYAR
ncbi:DNA-directed DNA polymerase [Desulfofarcimen acetoxidans DSM 771]|uniref:DNA polymerase IV n=1 Tax=Desulfofarcimen acetoxidans (strain ATCC 49208 / DSM 771 / KCTC 5769 / VKM B-1644 / 5575) TaxID=485916 RepID=C8W1S2_DESAS|nr:DNA polymerase IV [Desulfofarcimen acetoxidans]ACV63543.1 DNA-directed DNA polymerase [Desulfofarcimen acetoxidans DSM 771]